MFERCVSPYGVIAYILIDLIVITVDEQVAVCVMS